MKKHLFLLLLNICLIGSSTNIKSIDWWLYKPSEVQQLLKENQHLRSLVEAMSKNKEGVFEQIDRGLKKIESLEKELRCSLMVKNCIITVLVGYICYTWYNTNKTFVDDELDNAKQSLGHLIQQIQKTLKNIKTIHTNNTKITNKKRES